ncbi:hypothetical protein LZ198_29615 [Myxococcus sp. K15C18031901]|uniref:hypothetical protein n=1 Tax=Myxococcus dinghuensis TaxID=2906761 RepID=UPI0020A820E8|nr:hypothetical protein [Myxococcus dinghuensis]MCP3103045.1 hypothetical protein [Myxococcus dinghuensis]
MAHIVWFLAPLTCLHCGAHAGEQETRLHTSDLHRDPESISVRPGELLEVGLQEFDDAYLKLRAPVGTEDVRALEQWGCRVCHWAQWARIVFRYVDSEHYRFISAETVALTPEVVRDAHFISRHLDWWVETHPGEELERVRPLIKHLLS